MNMTSKKQIVTLALGVLGVIVLSSAAGGIAGSLVAQRIIPTYDQRAYFHLPSATSTSQAAQQPATTTASIKLVPLQMQDYATRVVPEPLFNHRSPVAIVYYDKKGSVGENVLTQDEQIGRAVAVTSDGWFVTVAGVTDNVRTADLVLWHDGRAYRVERAMFDKATQAVFLKTQAKDLSVTPFADMLAGRTGIAAWLEPSAQEFMPSSIMALRANIQSDPRSSERSDRRLLATGSLQKEERGAPVWDADGSLIGIVDNIATDRLQVIPGSALSASLQSLVSNNQIQHASLGVNAVDRTLIRSATVDAGWPEKGAWLEDSKSIKAVIKDSAADKAGLKNNDVILQVDRDILDGSSDLSDIILQYRPGSNVTLRIWRASKEIDVPVTLGTQVTSELLP